MSRKSPRARRASAAAGFVLALVLGACGSAPTAGPLMIQDQGGGQGSGVGLMPGPMFGGGFDPRFGLVAAPPGFGPGGPYAGAPSFARWPGAARRRPMADRDASAMARSRDDRRLSRTDREQPVDDRGPVASARDRSEAVREQPVAARRQPEAERRAASPDSAADTDRPTQPDAEQVDELIQSLALIADRATEEGLLGGIAQVIAATAKAEKALRANRLDHAIAYMQLAQRTFKGVDVTSLDDELIRAIPLIDQEIDRRIAKMEALKQLAE